MSPQAMMLLTASALAMCLNGSAMAADLFACLQRSSRLSVERRLCRRTWRHGIHRMPNPFAGRNGLSGGIQAGYNQQVGPGVLGAEIEGSYLGGAEHDVEGGKVKEKWRGAAKARAGVGFDQTLLFGTGGVALTKGRKGQQHRRMETRLSLRRRYRAGFRRRPLGQGRTLPGRLRFCMTAPSGYWLGPGAARASAWNCRFGRDRGRRARGRPMAATDPAGLSVF